MVGELRLILCVILSVTGSNMLTRREIHGDNVSVDIGIPSGGRNDLGEEKETRR